jgi:hypothetical protein
MDHQVLLQIFIAIFALFALSRAYLRFLEKKLSSFAFLFWLILWFLGTTAVFFPQYTTNVANVLGIGRGSDVVLYASVGLLFYLIFRIYILLDDIQKQITQLTRFIALNRKKPNRKRSTPKHS